jgi:hypothetical protein
VAVNLQHCGALTCCNVAFNSSCPTVDLASLQLWTLWHYQSELAGAAKAEEERARKAAAARALRMRQLTKLKASDEDLHTATTASVEEVIPSSARLCYSTALSLLARVAAVCAQYSMCSLVTLLMC